MTADPGYVYLVTAIGPDGSPLPGITIEFSDTITWDTPPELAGLAFRGTVAGPREWSAVFNLVPAHPYRVLLYHFNHAPRTSKPIHRCRVCNPAGNPRPLPVDGREYHRRRKAHRRGRRDR